MCSINIASSGTCRGGTRGTVIILLVLLVAQPYIIMVYSQSIDPPTRPVGCALDRNLHPIGEDSVDIITGSAAVVPLILLAHFLNHQPTLPGETRGEVMDNAERSPLLT